MYWVMDIIDLSQAIFLDVCVYIFIYIYVWSTYIYIRTYYLRIFLAQGSCLFLSRGYLFSLSMKIIIFLSVQARLMFM